MEESYRQAVEREIGSRSREDMVIDKELKSRGSPMRKMHKVPKKYYSKNVGRYTLEQDIIDSISISPQKK